MNTSSGRWLLLIHQIPAKPAYLRVKVGRQLARIGAIALKNTVYVLPDSEETREDFQWVLREVIAAGGEATLLSAGLVDGTSEPEIEALFRSARDNDFAAIADEARTIDEELSKATGHAEASNRAGTELQKLERRMQEVAAIDFFGASNRLSAQAILSAVRGRLEPPVIAAQRSEESMSQQYRDRVWVTRVGVRIDRIASAWLIKRFIDPGAQFSFVPAQGYVPAPGELRFDMFEAEFTHEGELCTFEVLVRRFGLDEPGLRAIAELVHDLDIKDSKYGRPEAPGLAAQISGIAALHSDDEARITSGTAIFEALLSHFAKQRA